MIKEITPLQAWEILQADRSSTLLDVRSTIEFEYVGHPLDALHIPWKEAPDWQVTADFVDKVRTALQKKLGLTRPAEELPILAICRSGVRSLSAAELLEREGFRQLYNVIEGFEGDRDNNNHRNTINGWRFHGLPWQQS
ncbi:MAG: rhodanese-like domain-containing protein [Proteobacteria bacterium]|nr:rhodanese-like domain-containing protein [Pseudomonadota bacterium]